MLCSMSPEPVRLEAQHAVFAIDRPAPGVVRLTVSGRDTGELGDAPFRELEKDPGAFQTALRAACIPAARLS
jgi:hypothetical protein